MYLLKRIDTNFIFDKILESGYEIDEKRDTISKVKFVNGKRKRVDSDYIDCIIKVNLGGIDADDIKDYMDNLEDGSFEYYSFRDQIYKRAKFLVEKPSITGNRVYSTTNYYIDDFTITLEKSDDLL